MSSEPFFAGPLQDREFLRPTGRSQKPDRARTSTRTPVTVRIASVATSLILSLAAGGAEVSSGASIVSLEKSAGGGVGAINLSSREDSVSLDLRDLREAWNVYLLNLSRQTGLPAMFEENAQSLWADLAEAASFLVPIPQAGPTAQDSFILSWNRSQWHFEIEIFADGRFEWFYRDRRSGVHAGAEGTRAEVVGVAIKHLEQIAAS